MEAINKSLQNIVLAKELIKEILKKNEEGNLLKVLELLNNTEELLVKS